MTEFEIAFNVCTLLLTAAVLLYLRHLVRVSGCDPIKDPDLVKKFKDTAPYHLLEHRS